MEQASKIQWKQKWTSPGLAYKMKNVKDGSKWERGKEHTLIKKQDTLFIKYQNFKSCVA